MMKKYLILLFFCQILFTSIIYAQAMVYTPRVIPCDCQFKMDSVFMAYAPPIFQANSQFPPLSDTTFKTQCGYLVVPENRKKPDSKMVRLPFIRVWSNNPDKKQDPVLFTSGGPGNSSLGWANGITKSTLIRDRDCIAFEQRGTRFALPYLRNFELDEAIRESYRHNLSKDSMVLEGVKRYKQRLLDRGIDLAGYNSDETVQDIGDLLSVLEIDSVNLFGGSYSGGLMLAVLQKFSSRVRSLVLDSPLPMFVPIDEDEPVNFMEGLKILSERVARDSLDQERYGHLKAKFDRYFRSIVDSTFYLPYVEKGTGDTLQIAYTKNELLGVIVDRMLNYRALKEVPYVITEIIKGNHSAYITQKLDNIFNRNPAPDGMRISVYCADQQAYHSEEIIRQLHQVYPYLAGYHINDVYQVICDCWEVPPLAPETKQAFYSNKPVLLGDGAMDAACRPLYMSRIKHYMPNAQAFLFTTRTHGVSGLDFFEMTQAFIDHPYQRLEPSNADIISY